MLNNIDLDKYGKIVRPDLHDADIVNIKFGRDVLAIEIKDARQNEFVINFVGNVYMNAQNIAQDNLILDAYIIIDPIHQAEILNGRQIGGEGAEYVANTLAAISRGERKIVEISPSYGGDFLILCNSVECVREAGRSQFLALREDDDNTSRDIVSIGVPPFGLPCS